MNEWTMDVSTLTVNTHALRASVALLLSVWECCRFRTYIEIATASSLRQVNVDGNASGVAFLIALITGCMKKIAFRRVQKNLYRFELGKIGIQQSLYAKRAHTVRLLQSILRLKPSKNTVQQPN